MGRICVTGGAGFIGSHVIGRLVELGHDVMLYDSFLQYVFPLERRHLYNVQRRMKSIGDEVEIVRGSTQDLDFLGRTMRRFQPTHIIHLAAMPLAKMAIEHPEEALGAIVNGTMNVLQVARNVEGFERFVYISSSMVYGDFVSIPAGEDQNKEPKEVYGGLKLSGEIISRIYSQLYQVDHAIIRPSAVYGPTDNNRRVLGIFLENALAGKPLEVRGAESALDFTYVTDTAEGIVLAALHEGGRNQTFNVTCGDGRTILEAAQIVASLVPGTEIRVEEVDASLPDRGTLDVTRARDLLGYRPRVRLEQGLELYLAYLKDQKTGEVL